MEKEQKNLFGKDYLTLSELAENGFFSRKYLEQAVKNRQLKAFKAGEDWLTTQDWFEDFKMKLKQTIRMEAGNPSRGIRVLPEKHFFWIKFWRFFVPALVASFLSTAVLTSVWFCMPEDVKAKTFSLSGKVFSWGRVAGITEENDSLPKKGF
ncbi:MAG: hypothetical protein AAB791_03080 [Patescibacteria group bacterium]